jgi:hypothetical protein
VPFAIVSPEFGQPSVSLSYIWSTKSAVKLRGKSGFVKLKCTARRKLFLEAVNEWTFWSTIFGQQIESWSTKITFLSDGVAARLHLPDDVSREPLQGILQMSDHSVLM